MEIKGTGRLELPKALADLSKSDAPKNWLSPEAPAAPQTAAPSQGDQLSLNKPGSDVLLHLDPTQLQNGPDLESIGASLPDGPQEDPGFSSHEYTAFAGNPVIAQGSGTWMPHMTIFPQSQ